MSECVVRMEMPENCETCPIRVNDSPTSVPNWICAISQWPTFYCKKSQSHANEDKYLHDCPIICSIPKGHGRLVDADELKAKQQEDADLFINAYTLMEKSRRDEALNAVANIVNAPTIVPAEAERSEHEV